MNVSATRLLLVEDNPGDVRLIKEFLRDSSKRDQFTVTTAGRLDEALKLLDTQSFDLILVDLTLPDQHGLGTVTQVLARIPSTPIIVITGLSDESMAVDALRVGAQDYLVKNSLTSEVLARSIRYAIERAKISSELQLREAQYRLLAENITDMIARHAPDSTLLYVSPSCQTLLGYEPEEMIGIKTEEFFHPDDLSILNSVRDLSRRTLNTYSITYRIRHKDGTYRWFETMGNVIRDPTTQLVIETISVSRDVTERQHQQQALLDSEARFKAISDTVPVAIGITRYSDTTILYANDFYCDSIGVPHGTAVGQQALRSYVNLEDRRTILGKIEKNTVDRGREAQIRRRDGTLRWVIVAVTAINFGGEAALLTGFVDITQIKELEKEHTLLAAMVESSADAIIGRSLDGLVLTWNQGAERLFGFRADEIVGKPIQILVPPELQDEVSAISTQLTRGDHFSQDETVRVTKADKRVDVSLTSSPVLDANGTPVAGVIIVRDITEQKRMTDTIRENEQKLRTIFDVLPVGISLVDVVDSEQQIVEINPALARILDLTPQDLVAGAYKSRRYIRPDGTPVLIHELPTIRAAVEQRPIYDVEVGVIKEDGATMWASISAVPLPETAMRVMTATLDITERKRADEQVHFQAHLLDTIEQAVITTDLQGAVIYWNHFAETLYGWSAAEALGRNLAELLVNQATVDQASETMASLKNGKSWSGEFDVQRRDGTVFPALVSDTPVYDPDGKMIAIIGVSTDITERKHAERALRQYNRRIEILHGIDRGILTAQSPQRIAQTVVEALGGVVNFDAARIISLSSQANTFSYFAASPPVSETSQDLLGRAIQDYGVPDSFRRGEALFIDDVQTSDDLWPGFEEVLTRNGVRSWIVVPLIVSEQLVGLLGLGSFRPSNFTAEDLEQNPKRMNY